MDKGDRMEYRVGDKVRIKCGLNNMHTRNVIVTSRMINKEGAIATIERADPKDNTYKIEGLSERWEDEMFEPVPLFSSGGIVPVNDPRLSDIIENAESEWKTTSKEYPILKQIDSETIKIIDRFNKEMRYRWSGCKWSEIGTKKSTGIESRKDIRKRLLNL